VKNYAHPTLAEHFSSEKMKQYQSLEDTDRDHHHLHVKHTKEQTNTLKVFEVYSPDTITKAMDRSTIKESEKRTAGHMKQMAEYIDAKNIREFLAMAKGQKGLFEDETNFERKGKRRFMPQNVIRY
jgi:hypothetical protein